MMSRKPMALTACALLAGAAVAAGCGSEEQNEYVDEVNALQNQLMADVNDAVGSAPPGDPKAFAEVSVELEQAFDATADDLEAVEPPEEVAAEHDELVAVVRDVGAQMGEAEQGLSSGNPQQAQQAAIELQTASTRLGTELDSIITEINSTLQE